MSAEEAAAISPSVVAIIGGGLSGTLCALHLLAARPDLQIRILERARRLGPGLAYGACAPEHILNVPVNRLAVGFGLSFESWLERTVDRSTLTEALNESGGHLGDSFVPRFLFGDYLEAAVSKYLQSGALGWVRGDAVAFLDEPGRGIILADGRKVEAAAVILALGNQAPASPVSGLEDLPEFMADPWAPGAIGEIEPDAPIAIIGSGLTMVDIVLALREQGHRGRITALSRRGLLPRAHAFGGAWTPFVGTLLPSSPAALMRIVRQEIRRAEIEGVPWQRVIDAVRPSIARVWESWSSSERRRFLRHLRPWWDVFRHRMPPRIAERIHVLIQSGDLEVRACRIRTFRRAGAELELAITQTTRADQVLRPKHVINCTGPRTDFDFLSSPIVLDARRRRLIRADPLDLGIETDACAVLDKNGKASDWLYAVGPLTRPAWWEITAAPEINAQILELARSFTAADTARASFAEVFQDLGAGI